MWIVELALRRMYTFPDEIETRIVLVNERLLTAPADRERLLPGNSLPLFETEIHARTNGYMKRRLVDIGDSVEARDLLAQIDTPDVDDRLDQAPDLAMTSISGRLASGNLSDRNSAAGIQRKPL